MILCSSRIGRCSLSSLPILADRTSNAFIVVEGRGKGSRSVQGFENPYVLWSLTCVLVAKQKQKTSILFLNAHVKRPECYGSDYFDKALSGLFRLQAILDCNL